jgi:hypothetical protein
MKIPPPRFPYGTIRSAGGVSTTEHPLLSADPQSAGVGLVEILGLAAGTEALFRAFLAEHDRDRLAARFWLQVYRNIVAAERGEGSATPHELGVRAMDKAGKTRHGSAAKARGKRWI